MAWNPFRRRTPTSQEAKWPTEAELKAAHDRATHNREDLECSEVCGCFYCLDTFPPAAIEEWTDDGTTAICSGMVDSVIGSASGRVDELFLKCMRAYWFRTHNRPWPAKMDEATLAAWLQETGYPPQHFCPACGLPLDFAPWDWDLASFEICPSCGIQFGYTDAAGGAWKKRQEVYSSWRAKWVKEGMPWRGAGQAPPKNWNPAEQVWRVEGRGKKGEK